MSLFALLVSAAIAQVPQQPFSAVADPLFSVGQGQTRDLTVKLRMKDGTKIYVDRVAIEVKDAAGLTIGELSIPAGEPFLDPFTDTDRPVYTAPVELLLPITGGDKKGRQELVIDVLWQGCSKNICYPPSGELLTVPVRVMRKDQ